MGSFAVDLHSSEESPSTFIEANEEVDGGMVFTTNLLARTVQLIWKSLIGWPIVTTW